MITEEIKTLLRAIADGKQMQIMNVSDKWVDEHLEKQSALYWIAKSALYWIAIGKPEYVRIKPELKRMYGHWTGDYWHFEGRMYGCEKFYFDIDPDTNEPIGPIKRIDK